MSYILQALRKAAQARGEAQDPGLRLVRIDTGKRRAWPWVLLVAILVLGGGLYWAGREGMPPAGQGAAPPAAPETAVPSPEPGPPATATVTPRNPGPAAPAILPAPVPIDPPAPGKPPATVAPPAVVEGGSTPPQTAVSAPPGDAAHPTAERKDQAATGTPPTAASPAVGEAATPPQPPAEPEVIIDTKLLEDLAAPAHSPPPAGPRLPERPGGDVDPAVVSLPLLEQMPSAVQALIPDIRITVMAYSEVPVDRVVYIKKQRYIEGDLVEGQFRIEQITRSGVVLSYQGQRFVLAP